MTNTSVNKNTTLNVWGRIIVLAVAVMFVRQDATAAQAPVALRSDATFAVLAATTVTTIPTTTVNGDVGVSPGNTVTGSPIVNGTTHLGDPTAAQAQLDLTTAYNDAAGRTVDAITVAGNLGGQTLAPGLYTSATSLEISSGDLTLDASGDPNGVWIFQMGSTLVTTVGRQVILSGGAQAANVFWQVGSSATIGGSSVFKGTIMANQSITMNTSATLEGRALARNGAVALDANTITIPAATSPVLLQSAAVVAGPYTDAAGQSVNLATTTITVPLSGSTQYYRIRSNKALTMTSITISGGNVVITYN
jgi:hypothetical protein